MKIDEDTLSRLETLSHLKIQESKKEQTLQNLNEILMFMENLNELETQNLDPFFSTIDGGTPLRDDVPKNDRSVSQQILSNAPRSDDDFFIVPAIIE